MYDLGGGGIKIIEFDPPVAYARCRSNGSSSIAMGGYHTIANNVVHSGGRSFVDATGILVSMSAHNTVVHNDVADFYNSGIQLVTIDLCNPDHTNSSHHNTVRFNRVHQIGQEVLSDMGGIYFFGPNENSVASYNEVFGVRHWGHGLPNYFASTPPYTPPGPGTPPLAGGQERPLGRGDLPGRGLQRDDGVGEPRLRHGRAGAHVERGPEPHGEEQRVRTERGVRVPARHRPSRPDAAHGLQRQSRAPSGRGHRSQGGEQHRLLRRLRLTMSDQTSMRAT